MAEPTQILVPPTWTQLLPAGYGQLSFHVESGCNVRLANATTAPVEDTSGVLFRLNERSTIYTTDATKALYGRSEYAGVTSRLGRAEA